MYRGTNKSWIMLENTKKIVQIQTVGQWHRKKWILYDTKTLTFTFHHYWGAFCQGSFVLDPYYIYFYLYNQCLSHKYHVIQVLGLWCLMATFNNISAISRRLVLLVKETRVSWEKHPPVASHWRTLSHNAVSSTPRHEQDSNSQR
jgi:hypothetical protein